MAMAPNSISPTHRLIIINSNVSSNPWPGNSINSTPDSSRTPGDVSHMNAAKHGCESFPVRLAIALRGNRNDGNGGGGMDSIVSGGASKHSGPHILVYLKLYDFVTKQLQFSPLKKKIKSIKRTRIVCLFKIAANDPKCERNCFG